MRKKATWILMAAVMCGAAGLARAGMGEDLAGQDICVTVHPLNERMEALLRYGNSTAEVYYMRRLVNDGERDSTKLDAVEAAAKAAGERLRQADPAVFQSVQADTGFASAMKYGSYGPSTRIQRSNFASLGLLDGSDYTATDGECYGRIPAANEPL